MLNLTDWTRVKHAVRDLVLEADDHRALVVTPADPLPPRRLHSPDPDTVVWQQDGPTLDKVKRVANWGWLRRQVVGYHEPNILHPAIGTAFTVMTWRYLSNDGPGNRRRTGTPLGVRTFDPIFIARLSDGRIFADQWASPSVLWDALNRWRNVQGCTIDWEHPGGIGYEDVPTCAIGGLDWATIPDRIAARRNAHRKAAA